jgi:hypothetical protein
MRAGLTAAVVGGAAVLAAGLYLWPGSGGAPSDEDHWALIGRYCTDCHNRAELAGGVAFDRLIGGEISAEAAVWEQTVRKLRGSLMPPPGSPRPEFAQVDALVDWLENHLDRAYASDPRVGRVTLRRLNRTEYANAVRDVVGVEIDPTGLLPQEPKVDGFDNIAVALQVSPAFIEQYVDAARLVADIALGNRHANAGSQVYRNDRDGAAFGSSSPSGGRALHVHGLPPGSRDGFAVTHVFPADGVYEINIADMASSLWVYSMEFENTIVVTVDGRRVYETTIGGEEDMRAIDQLQDPAVDAINARLKNIRFDAQAGQRQVAVTFVRRSHAESDDPLHQRRQGHVRGVGQDRLLRAVSFELSGPFEIHGVSPTVSRDRIFSCYPQDPRDELPCAEEIVARVGAHAFRRPLSEEDLRERLEYYHAGRIEGDFEEGIRAALVGILASPHFLYRAEQLPQTVAPDENYRLDDLALASRLSFFLWRSVPDEALRTLAARGELSRPDVLRAEVLRMLADPRSRSLADSFAYQWLHLDKMNEIQPDRAQFPRSSGANDLRGAFREEITLFVDSIFREDRSVVDLLTADHTYLNERLAVHYGINHVRGDRFRRVTLPQSERFGLLGKAGVLLASSYPNRTSPVLRGDYVMHHLIGTPPAAPPPDVEDNLDAESRGAGALTVREKLMQHATDPSCNACHGIIDPLGFALENFDVDGSWRDIDRASGRPIDAVGELPGGIVLDGPNGLRNVLVERSEQFVLAFTERLLTYALGRTLEHYDMGQVRRIVRTASADDYRFSTIVLGIVESDVFQMQQAPADGPAPGAVIATAAH